MMGPHPVSATENSDQRVPKLKPKLISETPATRLSGLAAASRDMGNGGGWNRRVVGDSGGWHRHVTAKGLVTKQRLTGMQNRPKKE